MLLLILLGANRKLELVILAPIVKRTINIRILVLLLLGEENAYAEIGEVARACPKTTRLQPYDEIASLKRNARMVQDISKETINPCENGKRPEHQLLNVITHQNHSLSSVKECPEYRVLEGPEPNFPTAKRV